VEDWIYYIDTSGGGKIKKIRTDGSEETQICDVRAKYLNYTEQWLVFLNLDDSTPKEASQAHKLFGFSEPDSGKIYKIKHDGSALSSVCPAETTRICTAEDWVYYICGDNNKAIHRVNLNNEVVEKVSEKSAHHLNFADNWVYFSADTISRIRGDDTGFKVLYKYSAGLINVVGEWIYFLENVDFFGNQMSRVRTDGSGYSPLHKKGRGAKHLRVKFEDGKSYIYRTFDRNIKLGSKVLVEGKKAAFVGEVIEEDAKYNKGADAQYISEVISYGTGRIEDLSDQAKESIQNLVPKKAKSYFIVEVKKSNRSNSKTVYCKTKDLDVDVGTIVAYKTTWNYGRYQEEIGVVIKRRVKGVSAANAYEVIKKFPLDSNLADLRKENTKKEAEHREKYKAKMYNELLKPESAAIFEDVIEKDADSDLVAVLFDDLRTYSYKNADPKLNIGAVVQVTRAGKIWEGKVVLKDVKPKPDINYLSILKVLSYGEDEA
jgi:hypothetical protein